MKKFISVILSIVLLFTVNVFNISAAGTEETQYPVGDWIVDLEFDNATELDNLSTSGTKPTVGTLDNKSVAVYDQKATTAARIDFWFQNNDERITELKDKINKGPVAFEVSIKVDGGGDLRMLNGVLTHKSNNRVYFGPNANSNNLVKTINNLSWTKVAFIMNYSSGSPVLEDIRITTTNASGTETLEVLNVSDYISKLPTTNDLLSRALWAYMLTSTSYSNAGSKVYLDYYRVYVPKKLEYKGSDVDFSGVPVDTNEINMKFSYPLDEMSAILSVTVRDENGDFIDASTERGTEENAVKIKFNSPLEYSKMYKIHINNLAEKDDPDKVKMSMEQEFYVENQPLFEFENFSIVCANSSLTGSVNALNNLPKDKKVLFLTQFYSAENKLLKVASSGEKTVSAYDGSADNTELFSPLTDNGAVKAKIYVFDESYKNIYGMYEVNIER